MWQQQLPVTRRIDLIKSFQFVVSEDTLSSADKQKLRHHQYPTKRILINQLFFSAIKPEVFALIGNCKLGEILREAQSSHECKKLVSIFMERCQTYHGDIPDPSPSFDYFAVLDTSFLNSLNEIGTFVISLERTPEISKNNKCDWSFIDTADTKLQREVKVSQFLYNYRDKEVDWKLFQAKNTKAESVLISDWSYNPIRLNFELNISLEVAENASCVQAILPAIKLQESSILQLLFGNQSNKDFTIVAADGVEILCHKIILSAHSNVFEAMVNSNMKEGNVGVVNFDDMNGEAVNHLIRYFYGMEIPPSALSCDTTSQLFYAAHKYKLVELGRNVGFLLLSKEDKWFTTDGALELYFLTEKLGTDFANLRERLFQILARFPSDMLKSSQRFKELQPDQAVDLMMKLMDKLNLRM